MTPALLLMFDGVQLCSAGSGCHLPSAPHTASTLSSGTNPSSHWKEMTQPSTTVVSSTPKGRTGGRQGSGEVWDHDLSQQLPLVSLTSYSDIQSDFFTPELVSTGSGIECYEGSSVEVQCCYGVGVASVDHSCSGGVVEGISCYSDGVVHYMMCLRRRGPV